MYRVETTPGFIVDSRLSGEAGKILMIFTRDLGLIQTTAQGIRLEKSKLRYHTQNYSFGSFSVVRGKEFWRLTSAQGVKDSETFGQGLRTDYLGSLSRDQIELIARVASLLRRLLNGEEVHPELFDIVEAGVRFLRTSDRLNVEQTKTFESVFVLRILDALGYIGRDDSIDDAVTTAAFSANLLDILTSKRPMMNQHINRALRESQL